MVAISRTSSPKKPLVTLVVAAYNESSILEKNLRILCDYMIAREDQYDWEIVLLNDGSEDNTGAIAELFAKNNPNVRVFHHSVNMGLGSALKHAFEESRGDYVITLDIDLSCSPEHIEKLLQKQRQTDAVMVTASPTAAGGKMTRVPWHRKLFSRSANRFLTFFSRQEISNLTCMTRSYNGPYIRSLHLYSEGMEIMPEIAYKTMLLQERIVEIPADLNWTALRHPATQRRSSMRLFKHTMATLFTGFLLRPVLFFLIPSLLLLVFSLYANAWVFVHFFQEYSVTTGDSVLDHMSHALGSAYQKYPHTYIFGLLSLVLVIQLMAVGLLSMQSRHYFEEGFQLGTKIYRREKDRPR